MKQNPIFGGILSGIAGTKINSPLIWWRVHLSASSTRLLSKLWLWSLAIYLLWVPAEFILGYFFGANNPILAPLPNIPIPLVFVVLAVLGGFAHDIQHDRRFVMPPGGDVSSQTVTR